LSLLLDALKEAQKQRQGTGVTEQNKPDANNNNEEVVELELELDLEAAVQVEEEPGAALPEEVRVDDGAPAAAVPSEPDAGQVASAAALGGSPAEPTATELAASQSTISQPTISQPASPESQPRTAPEQASQGSALGSRVKIDSPHSANAVFRNRGRLKEKRPLAIALSLLCLVLAAVMAYVFFLSEEYSPAPQKVVRVQKVSSPEPPLTPLVAASHTALPGSGASTPARELAETSTMVRTPASGEPDVPALGEEPMQIPVEQRALPSEQQNSVIESPQPTVVSLPQDLTARPDQQQVAVSESAAVFSGIQIRKRRIPEKRNEQLRLAQEALQGGQLQRAEASFSAVLKTSADNVAALLGMANLLAIKGQYEQAQLFYRQVLALKPQHLSARAGLLSLASSSSLSVGSALQQLIAESPQQAFLHASLGDYYLKRREWAAAQKAYFDAFSRDAKNADYAYNLAICLDQMLKPKLALEFYRQALELEKTSHGRFDSAVVAARITVLKAVAR